MYDFLLVPHCNYSSLYLVPFASYLTLNNIVSLKSGLEVTSLKMVPFESLGAVSYSNYGRICSVCEIFSVIEWCDLENRVRVRSRSLKMAPFDRPHTSSYSPSIVTMAISCIVREI